MNRTQKPELCLKSHFSEPSYRPVNQDEYIALGDAFISQIAPTLREDLRTALSKEVAEQLIGTAYRGSFGHIETPILQLNKTWLWPEIAKAFPFTPGGWGGFSRHELWGGEHSSAFYKAENLKKELEYHDFKNWCFATKMTLIREWRNQYLPTLQKRTSKFLTVLALLSCHDFVRDITFEFRKWQDDIAREIEQLINYANQEPIPRHLEWLAWLVTHRLDAHHSYFNSESGPQAFDDRVDAILNMAMKNIPPNKIEIENLFGLNNPIYTSVYGEDTRGIGIELLEIFIANMTDLFYKPAQLSKHLTQYRPNEFKPKFVCEECTGSIPPKRIPGSKPRLSPFHLLCRCRDFKWSLKTARHHAPMSDYERQNVGAVELWIAEALAGGSEREFPIQSLYSHAHSVQFEREWQDRQSLHGKCRRA